jgi:hypothetical protein
MYCRISPPRGHQVQSSVLPRLLAVSVVVMFSACVMSQSRKDPDAAATPGAKATTSADGTSAPAKTAAKGSKGDKSPKAKAVAETPSKKTTTTTAKVESPKGTKAKNGPDTAKLAQEVNATLATAGSEPLSKNAPAKDQAAKAKAAPAPAVKMPVEQKFYVSVDRLNVRLAPHEKAPVVKRLARGVLLNVVVQGEWARIADGKWVSVKLLTKAPLTAKKKLTASK